MKVKAGLSVLLSFLIMACANEPTQPAISQEDALNTAIASVKQTQAAVPSATFMPTPEQATSTIAPAETQIQSVGKEYSWNYLASQDSGGVNVTIARVYLADMKALPTDLFESFSLSPLFMDKPVIGEILFIIENKTSGMVKIYANQGLVLVGSEQIELIDYAIDGIIDTYSGDILPGAKLIGGTWFGIKRTTLNEINSMTIYIPAAYDSNVKSLGADYNFVLDLSQKQFVELPDELK